LLATIAEYKFAHIFLQHNSCYPFCAESAAAQKPNDFQRLMCKAADKNNPPTHELSGHWEYMPTLEEMFNAPAPFIGKTPKI